MGRCRRGRGRRSGWRRPGPPLVRLAAATTDFDQAPPDLVVCGGGVWSAVPAPTVALAHVDVLRRSGASQYALDHARLMGVLGVNPR